MIESKPAPQLPERDPVDLLPPLPTMYTYDDVARVMRVSKQTVFEWVKLGKVPPPVYTGHTARFTEDTLKDIMAGVKPAGTFVPPPSPRAEVGKLGGPKPKKKKRKKGTPKTEPAKAKGWPKGKPRAKKPKPKKLAAPKPAALKVQVMK